MKLDATDLRYLSSDEFRVLTAVEMGSKNHEVVPTQLISQISGLRHGGVNKLLGGLAQRNLVSRVQNAKYDGYRLTYGGLDFLAMRALSKRGTLHSVGNQIGVGKEADVYVVGSEDGEQMVLKLHRLGRISFRAIKSKRDYLGKRKSASWMYMSRLSAQKEWAFMKVLHEHGFPVPKPIDQARHCILMELIDSYPLRQIAEHPSPGRLYSTLMDLIVRLARAGLIHGDFNEFNILIREETGEPVLIDFPQMVSTSHENAEWYFNRDVECIRTFFRRRFGYESALYPKFRAALKDEDTEGFTLDVEVAASGFGRKEQNALEQYMDSMREEGGPSDGEEDEEDESSDEVEEEEEEEEEEAEVKPGPNDASSDHDAVEESAQEQDNLLTGDGHDSNTLNPRPGRPFPTAGATGSEFARGLVEDEDSDAPTHGPTQTGPSNVKEIVSTELSKQHARQKAKYHSGPGSRRPGRAKGSKAKQDTRVKVDKSGVWE